MNNVKKQKQLDLEEDNFLEIDLFNLEKEWSKQPKLYFKYARLLGEARNRVDEEKAEFELVCAKVEADIRDQPDKYGVNKVTDKAVTATVPMQKSYQIALANLNEAKKQVAYLDAAVEALEHRKKALEKVVDLHIHEYYAEPRQPKGGGQESFQRMREDAAFSRKKK